MPGDKWPRHDPEITAGGRLGLIALVLIVAFIALLPLTSLIRG